MSVIRDSGSRYPILFSLLMKTSHTNKIEKKKITQRTFKFLMDKLREMKTIGRKLLADKLDHYRNDETYEENSAMSDVLEEKESLEKEISELEGSLEDVEIVKEKGKCKVADVGCKVQLDAKGKKMKIEVVSSLNANPIEKKISSESPLGKAVIGKKVGESVLVETPSGKTKYKISKID